LLIVLASVGAVLNIAKTIVGVGGLIFVHELGHFLVGRWCGVHAEAFSIGFGPVLLKWNGKPTDPTRPDQTTEYRLSAIPLGGYVKFLGENPDERADPDPRSFNSATYPRKVAIMLAGVTMNVIAAFALFAVTFGIGWDVLPPIVGAVQPGQPAWEHGIAPGDEIVSINGMRTLDYLDLKQDTMLAKSIDAVVRRDGVERRVSIPTADGGDGLRIIGVVPKLSSPARLVVTDGSAAAAAGFRSDDRLVAVDGKAAADFEAAKKIHADAKKATTWTVERGGAKIDLTLPWSETTHPALGVELGPDFEELVVQKDGPAAAAGLRSGDRPVSVGGVATKSASRFTKLLAGKSDAGEAGSGDVVVLRAGTEVKVPLPAAASRAAFAESIAPISGTNALHAWLMDGPSPARAAGLPDGCELTSVDDRPVATVDAFRAAVKTAFDEHRAAVVKWKDDGGRDGTTSVTPENRPEPDLGGLGAMYESRTIRADGVGDALALALDRTERWTMRIVHTLASLFGGGVSVSKLSGPIGISTQGYQTAKSSIGDFLMFLGMLSMNLAVLNVLPLPILDGGQLAIHTIERIRRRPIPERVLEAVQWSGLILLLGFVVYVSKNDILNLMR
jgi:regulator of sigma E protease